MLYINLYLYVNMYIYVNIYNIHKIYFLCTFYFLYSVPQIYRIQIFVFDLTWATSDFQRNSPVWHSNPVVSPTPFPCHLQEHPTPQTQKQQCLGSSKKFCLFHFYWIISSSGKAYPDISYIDKTLFIHVVW